MDSYMDDDERVDAVGLSSRARAVASADDEAPARAGHGTSSRGSGKGVGASAPLSSLVGEKRGRQRYHGADDDEEGGSGAGAGDDDHSGKRRRRRDGDDDDQDNGDNAAGDDDGHDGSGKQHPPRIREKKRKVLKEHPRELSVGKFMRGGTGVSDDKQAKAIIDGTTDKKLKSKLKFREQQYRDAAREAARAELLLTEEGGYLEADGPMERTYRYKQADIAASVDISVSKRAVNLSLDTYGPYATAYSRNGRAMLLAGAKGHIAVLDWNTNRVSTEFHVKESVRDACFLHDASMVAVAQKKHTFIYDHKGAEIHRLKSHVDPVGLDYLPYHFLLTSIGNAGYIKWQDVSTGQLVAEHNTHCHGTMRDAFRQNPWNALMMVGQSNGTVSMWSPNMSTPCVRIAAHRGGSPVSALAVDSAGRYMVTAGGGSDARVKIWDIRKFQEDPIFSYFTPLPVTSVDISQRGFVAVGFGSHVQVWGRDFATELSKESFTGPMRVEHARLGLEKRAKRKEGEAKAKARAASAGGSGAGSKPGHVRFDDDDDDDEEEEGDDEDGDAEAEEEGPAEGNFLPGKRPNPIVPKGVKKATAPYLKHELPGKAVSSVRFKPYDDFLGVGHSHGFSSLIVPGAGEANYDSREGGDVFATKKARKEATVHALLDKLSPTMITLDPTAIGAVDTAGPKVREKEQKAAAEAAEAKFAAGGEGLSKSQKKRLKRKLKKGNVVTAQRLALKEKMIARHVKEKEERQKEKEEAEGDDGGAAAAPSSALSRFYGKRK